MSQELLYTSAPQGLKPGSRGFCTVVSTQGMPSPLASALESISGYRPVFPPGDPNTDKNPVVYSHLNMSAAGKRYHVLSRIADYGLDYSQRANKIAHHVVLEPHELASGGPVTLLGHSGFMETSWDGKPRILPAGRSIPNQDQSPGICHTWQKLTGDAGWAGVLAESLITDSERQAYLIFQPGMDVLALMSEAIALLPHERRWEASFSTYFTSLPPGVNCNWRCVLAGSSEANQSRRFVRALRIDLTQPVGKAEGGNLVEMARTGKSPSRPVPSAPLTLAPEPQSPTPSPVPITRPHSAQDISQLPPLETEDDFKTLPPDPGRSRKGPPSPPRPHKTRERKASTAKDWLVWAAGFALILGGGATATYFIFSGGKPESHVAEANTGGLPRDTKAPRENTDPKAITVTGESTQPSEDMQFANDSIGSEEKKTSPANSNNDSSPPKTTAASDDLRDPPPMASAEESNEREENVSPSISPAASMQVPIDKTSQDAEEARAIKTARAPNLPYYIDLPDLNGASQKVSLNLPNDFPIDEKTTLEFILPNIPQQGHKAWPEDKKRTDTIEIREQINIGTILSKCRIKEGEILFQWEQFSPSLSLQAQLIRFCALRVESGSQVLIVILHDSSAESDLLGVADEHLEKELIRERKSKPLSESKKSWTIMPRFSFASDRITSGDRRKFPLEHFPKLSLASLTLKSSKDKTLYFEPVKGKPSSDPKDKIHYFANELDLESSENDLDYPLIVHEANGMVEIGVNRYACAAIQNELDDQFRKLLKTIPPPDDSSRESKDRKPTKTFTEFEKELRRYAREISGSFFSDLRTLETTPWRYTETKDTFDEMLRRARELKEASQELKLIETSDDLQIANAEVSYEMTWDHEKPGSVLLRYQSPQKKTN